jgi:large subunit ribosomal protein L19e
MPGARNQRRLAAKILKCGVNRVWIDPTMVEDVEGAITRGDIRGAIASGSIMKKPVAGISSARKNYLKAQRKKGRRRGSGSRKGGKNARTSHKEVWMKTIRAVRKRLVELRDAKLIDRKTYRKVYKQSKGGVFKSRAHLDTQLKMSGVIKETKVTEAKKDRGEK